MTEPYYNCDLYPGFIADYEFEYFSVSAMDPKDDPWHSDDLSEFGDVPNHLRFYYWLCKYMKGPYIVKGPNTAHWAYNVVISHPHDAVWIRTNCLNVKKVTESIRGFDNPAAPQTPVEFLDHDFIMPRDYIRYGCHADFKWIREWLAKNPCAITSELDRLKRDQRLQESEKHTIARLNWLLDHRGIKLDLNKF